LPAGDDPDTFVQKQGRAGFVAELKASKPYLEFLLDRAAAEYDLSRDEPRREFLNKMLTVAARIPDPVGRDHFADRLAHKARVTEAVVRAEIRKAAGARKTELPAARIPTLMGQLRGAERGLLWGLIHNPGHVLPCIRTLEDADLEGLSSGGMLRIARELSSRDPSDVPNALMERLSTTEAQWLAAIASQASAPVLDAELSVRSIKRLRLERERAQVQREIDHLQTLGNSGPDLTTLLQQKLALQRRLEHDDE
jgi:DNA primase